MTLYEIAQMQKAQGVVTSIYLDGGGSATYASRHGGGSLEIQNHPSDGAERVVASSLLVVSTAKQTGKFDHAVLEPNNALYIAGAKVQFTASGVDAAAMRRRSRRAANGAVRQGLWHDRRQRPVPVQRHLRHPSR